jgi:hypothetical protein
MSGGPELDLTDDELNALFDFSDEEDDDDKEDQQGKVSRY